MYELMLGKSFNLSSGGEADIGNGLQGSHAYTVQRVVDYSPNSDEENVKLIQLRNPWGATEWEGAWSDNSPEMTQKARYDLDCLARDDGSFWMPFAEYVKNFISVDASLPTIYEGGEYQRHTIILDFNNEE
jgi:hypothetical protein